MQQAGDQLIHQQAGISVFQSGDYRYLKFDGEAIQSRVLMTRPAQLVEPYFRRLMVALLFIDEPRKMLLMGLGGGALVHFLRHHFNEQCLQVIEKNPAVIQVARTFFALPEPGRDYHLIEADAFDYVSEQAASASRQDLLLVDIYTGDTTPPDLFGDAFLWDCYTLLNSQGVLAINYLQRDQQQASRDLLQLKAVFNGGVLVVPVPDRLNIIVIAFKHTPMDLRYDVLRHKAEQLSDSLGLPFKAWLDEIFALYPQDPNLHEPAITLG